MSQRFEFDAQSNDGTPIRGALDVPTGDAAQATLSDLGLQILSIKPASTPARSASLNASELELFNEQLIQLTKAGLPMERGLTLLASDLRSSRLKSAMNALAKDLSDGKPIEAAIESHQKSFPPIYARLIHVGIRTSNLPGVLHSFGKHLETVARLKQEMWRACAYPLMILAAFALLTIFLSYFVLPQYFRMLRDFNYVVDSWNVTWQDQLMSVQMPSVVLSWVGHAMPWIAGGIFVLVIGIGLIWRILKVTGHEGPWIDAVVLRIPLLGPALIQSYLARWTDTVGIGVRSGLDLPQAIELAGHVVAIPSLEQDSISLVHHLASGQSLDTVPKLKRLPESVPGAMELGSHAGNLPATLSALTQQFWRRAQQRTRLIPATLVPILIILIGLCAGLIVYGLWVPLMRVLQIMSGFTGRSGAGFFGGSVF